MRKFFWWILCVAVVVAFTVSCGGGGGGSTSITPNKPATPAKPIAPPVSTDSNQVVEMNGLKAMVLRDTSGLPIGVKLTWTRQAEASGGYNVYRSTSSMSGGLSDPSKIVNDGAIANPGSGTDVTWDDIYFGAGSPPAEAPPTWGQTYYYRVTNINDTDDESDVSNELNITIGSDLEITGFDPGSASILDTVVIQGDGFGSTQETGDKVQFRDTPTTWLDASINSWSDTEISVVVPTGAITGHVKVTLENAQSSESTADFTVIAPAITDVDCGGDTQGQVGDTVTITGTNFETSRGSANGKVFFGTVECASGDYVSWSDTSIDVKVPTVATSDGDIKVKTGNNESNVEQFDVLPKITNLSVSQGEIGSSVTITGTTFGATKGNSFVSFGSTTATTTSWGNTSITATVPTGISGQVSVKVTVKANVDGVEGEETLESNTLNYNVKPTLTSLDSNRKTVQQTLTLTGNGFGSSRGTSTVTFDCGTGDDVVVGDSDYTNWTQTSITVNIPDNAKTGNVFVTVATINSDNKPITIVLPPPDLNGGEQI